MNTVIADVVYPRITKSIADAVYESKKYGADGTTLEVDLNESVVILSPFKLDSGKRNFLDYGTSISIPASNLFYRYLESSLGVPEKCITAPGVIFSIDLTNA